MRDVQKVEIVAWLRSMKRHDGRDGPLNDGTKASVLATFSSILDYAVDTNTIAVNPVKAIGRKSKPRQGRIEARILGTGELDALLGACARFPWLRDIIRASFYGALRLGEVCGLQWGDVDFDNGRIRIARQLGKDRMLGTPKGGVAAEIPMIPQMRMLLLEIRNRQGALPFPTAPVFANKFGGYRQGADVQRAFSRRRGSAPACPRSRGRCDSTT